MAKFTKGEWTTGPVEEECGEARISIYSDNGKLIADVWLVNPDSTVTPEEGKANAELMTAAPDMYELLKDQVECYNQMPMSDLNYAGIEWIHKAHKVLAKAEGREPDGTD